MTGGAGGAALPGYDPKAHGAGIVHLGLGAFHKAHQAVYTDDALAAAGGDWRIIGVSLRSTEVAQVLQAQGNRFAVIERDSTGTSTRVIGALAGALSLQDDRAAVLAALCAPTTRIVSLTVTEKGYGFDRATGGIDRSHPAIAHDLATPCQPIGAAGLLVWALAQRRAAGIAPFTVLCCDNLPDNGRMLRALLQGFAAETAPDLLPLLRTQVAFPATMVDRITPASGPGTRALALALTGQDDAAAVETERFRQWVIEDDFPTGRPAWDAGGALFVADVTPYEEMKLRMLNGAHSMLAYAGFLAGHRHVRDVMQDAALARLVRRHMHAAAQTLAPVPGVDLTGYAEQLCRRFENPHLAHETRQIAMDGTQKLPQRIFAPALEAMARGQSPEPFAFACAAWMRFALGVQDGGADFDLRDPRAEEIRQALDGARDTDAVIRALAALPGFMPATLQGSDTWLGLVRGHLEVMRAQGMRAAIEAAAAA
ncbi:mannitol dehydrogenase family protein [Tropicibacter oceani]|uniref:Mannitol dehydrogenase family protein n=1 Tax=Tropicibacter oceani TaxID=3058420 RepID=A0ABY8QK70_9RHOB|nr:mannitol dehydrogenase family protein [Tropicibacter oceani]WGW04929.1 mannitol dehydrogenase family protein [Tropicibacter oceani]